MIGRVPIKDVRPQVACGRWPSRAVVGETVTVTATIFREGHDEVGAAVILRGPDRAKRPAVRMRETNHGLAQWEAQVAVDVQGRWTFVIESWADPIATWRHGIKAKHAAGVPIEIELEEGAQLLERAVAGVPKAARAQLTAVIAKMRCTDDEHGTRLGAALAPDVVDLLDTYPLRGLVTTSEKLAIWVDRKTALFSAWYEMFPRSVCAEPGRPGTLRTATTELPRIASLGFDVVYLPPIHPIGNSFRKGRNNSLVATATDTGSPWAIGNEFGGHDAIDPSLGTLKDFDAFVAKAGKLGLQVALDYALQCSPDHPWVKEHPEWFTTRADGSIAYAENPPKKYQDIYPLNFDNDPDGLSLECLRVLRHWMAHGVRIFRVDNPHTKPLAFWEWLIADVKSTDPDVLFLSEAFTRPPVMQSLAQIGFTQSYTYFTWRNTKHEIEEYCRELAHTDVADYMRPNFWPNTPDILHEYLQYGGPAAFSIRATLAAMLSPSWGMYSGYELLEATALRPGSEEYLDSEKFQLRRRDYTDAPLAGHLTLLNQLRREHPALQWLKNLRFHAVDNDQVIAFSKRAGDDCVLVVVNLDPHNAHEATMHLDLAELGLSPGARLAAQDQVSGSTYTWDSDWVYVRLDPYTQPAHIFTVRGGLMPLETNDPEWYRRAVFYEVLVRGFYDSNGDGTGDLAGLMQKMDYLHWLGVDCLWLLPIFESPLRDGGYDIADYLKILPEFGDLGDFVNLVDEAHRRGIRIITDLVMNHTSDQHPWFQSSREDPDGFYGDFYVWRDTDQLYPDARIIFVDTEKSNWTWDPVRQQYYWHRFFSHQPDLNFDNPAVQDAMIEVLRFWLDLGIDGFRLDAVPYLFEEDGTNCENLKPTHAYLKRVRQEIDEQYTDRVLLAEANQWPSDVVEYFGNGDECHMAFHFPLMPRIFMAARREQRYPVTEVLANTPQIPGNCQWGIFLRNHDELTLEMVTDEERDYMYSEYAKDPRMKANIGIRRRLAPLLDNSRDLLELFQTLLLSLPGSPVLYYGDEIGMGDNIYLGDRDGVRTPMQWSGDRNGGFSSADPQRLYLPLLLDAVYGYPSVNIDGQMRSPTSLLHWTKRMIDVRKQHQVFGLGSFEDLGGSNPSVFAFLRQAENDTVVCISNLSRFAQYTELDLSRFNGCTPVELLGGVHFPRIGELPYLLTLAPHGSYWFQVREEF